MAADDFGSTDQNTDIAVGDGATGTTSTATDGADLLLNDSDPDDPTPLTNTLTMTAVNGDPDNIGDVLGGIAGSNGGRFTIAADGAWRFDPNGEFDDLAAGKTRETSIEYTIAEARPMAPSPTRPN